jgi:shikimate dehydrogenase
LVYNPLQTPWRREAKALKIPSFCGLSMLVHQAVKAREIVDQTTFSETQAQTVLDRMHRRLSNIVLIGLPLSGKSKLATLLSKEYHLPLLDSDADIETASGKTIEVLFREDGETVFRQKELAWALAHKDVRGCVISTGGGMIENPVIVKLLQKNGFLVFLDKNPQTVHHVSGTGRPLLTNEDAFRTLHAKRLPLYLQAADLTIPAETPKETILHLIEVNWHEAARR